VGEESELNNQYYESTQMAKYEEEREKNKTKEKKKGEK